MLFKLTLKHFKNWEKKEIEFQEGISVIVGNSGIGKTSIFKSILFVLFGIGSKCQTFGKKNCSVTLETPEIIIERQKGPNKLKIIYNEQILFDSEAQMILNTRFGKEFPVSNYIPQKGYNSFMYMTSRDKLLYLESFLLDGVENKKEKVKEELKLENKKLTTLQSEIETLVKYNIKPKEVICEYNTTTFFDELKELRKRVAENQQEYDKNERNKQIRTNLMEELNSLEIVSINTDTDINELRKRFEKRKQRKRLKNEIEKLNEELNKLILPTITNINYDNDILLYKEYANIKRELKSLPIYEKIYKKFYTCYNCNTKLWLENDVLLQAKIEDEFENMKLENISIEEMNKREKVQKERIILKERSNKLPSFDKDCVAKNSTQEENRKKHLVLSTRREELIKRISNLEQERENIPIYDTTKEEITKLEEIIKKNERIKCRQEFIKKELEDINIENVELNQKDITKLEKYTRNEELVHSYIQYQKELEKYNEINEELSEKQKQEKLLLVNIEALSHLFTTLSRCENIAITQAVNSINAHSRIYLNSFFSTPLSIELQTFKEASNKTMKPQITTSIFYNSCSDYDFTDLSGGEKDRVALAFTLALSELSPIPLTLLDESISSLDENTFANVISSLKENYSGSVLMIGQQVSTGLFDNLIHLD